MGGAGCPAGAVPGLALQMGPRGGGGGAGGLRAPDLLWPQWGNLIQASCSPDALSAKDVYYFSILPRGDSDRDRLSARLGRLPQGGKPG